MGVIALATPSLGLVSIFWARTCASIIWPMNTGKSIFYLRDGEGGEVAETRNAIVDQVLTYDQRQKVSHILWVDDDVLVQPGCLLELLHFDRDIASGVYFSKVAGHGSQPLIFPSEYGGADHFRPNEVYETWGHGMGLCLIKTDVYKRMHRELKLGRDKYNRVEFYKTAGGLTHVGPDNVLHTGFTEDLYFLGQAAKLGIKPLVVCTKPAFGWHLDSATDTGYPETQWKQMMADEPVRWQTPAGEVVWD
jgi:hypothetical protein